MAPASILQARPGRAKKPKNLSETFDGKLTAFTITEARRNLPLLVRRAASGEDLAAIGVKGKNQVVLLSFARFKALKNRLAATADVRQQIAEGITTRLLRKAPSHLVVPQVRELAALSLRELAVLLPLERLPLGPAERSHVLAALKKNGAVLDRLEKRHAIAQAIATAAGEGLYETLEDRTSDLGIWESADHHMNHEAEDERSSDGQEETSAVKTSVGR